MKARPNSIVAWDFSLWFALLSPVIGTLLGILGGFLLYSSSITGRRHKDENDKPQTNQRRKTTETLSMAATLARSDARAEYVDL
jgi:hypothetical protein